MFGFPASTEYGKRIPKQKFYENIEVKPAVRRAFSEQIKLIYWRNKLAASTLNIARGEAVTEVEVFELRLHEPRLDEAVLRQIDREIPYHILFVLTCDGKAQAWIGYKEASAGSAAFKVDCYYHTGWMPEGELSFTVTGLNMDAVYAELMRQCRGESVEFGVWSNELSLAANVANDKRRRQLIKEIAALEKKIRKEKQLNRQMEMNAELKKKRLELEGLK